MLWLIRVILCLHSTYPQWVRPKDEADLLHVIELLLQIYLYHSHFDDAVLAFQTGART